MTLIGEPVIRSVIVTLAGASFDRLATRLAAAGIPAEEAALDAELLARHVLGWDRATLVARVVDEAPAGFEAAVRGRRSCDARAASRSPTSSGAQEFWGRDFLVRPGVLIPAPGDRAHRRRGAGLGAHPAAGRCASLDIGTGSGCLADHARTGAAARCRGRHRHLG